MISAALAVLETEERRNELSEFYDQNKNGLYAYALARTQKRELAEDAVHETLLKIAKYPEGFFALPVHKRMSYAVIVIGNVIRDLLKENAKYSEIDENLADDSLSVEDMALGSVSSAELKAFIRSMPEAQRQAIILKLVHDMTNTEIAAALNISEQTARKRVSNAYKTIREFLKGD